MSAPVAAATTGFDGKGGRIRLMQFVGAFATGGTERLVVSLCRGLDPGKFDLSFGCHKLTGEFLSEIDTTRTPVSEYPIRSLYPHRALGEQIRLARDLKRARVQIVHAY